MKPANMTEQLWEGLMFCSARFRSMAVVVAILVVILAGCEDNAANKAPDEVEEKVAERAIPETFSEALDALDAMASEEDRAAYRNDQVDMGLVHRQIGMQLRNDWGLRGDSKLKNYFAERGIANADWISSAIFEGWIQRLKTGSFDEEAVVGKYAKIEKDWRAWSENPDSFEQPEDGAADPFADEPAEQDGADEAADGSKADPEGDGETQSKSDKKLADYEVVITDLPRIETLADNLPFAIPIDGKTTLIEFLGGVAKIERIVIGVVANEGHGELIDSIVRKRFAESVCMDARKDKWSYAPFAVGTVHFVGGMRQSFGLHLSGISIAGHLFADSEGGEKPQKESEEGSR